MSQGVSVGTSDGSLGLHNAVAIICYNAHLRLWVRNDKYASKVLKYFVEFSDKEATKKVRVESEKRTSTEEAGLVCPL